MAMSLLRSLPMAAAPEACFLATAKPAFPFLLSLSSPKPPLLLSISTKKHRFSFTPLVASSQAAADADEDATFSWSDSDAASAATATATEEEEEEQEEATEWDVAGGEGEDEGDDGGVVASGEEGEEEVVEGEEGEGEYVEPPEEAKLFVGNLPYDMDSERLAQLFEQAGIVEVAEVIYNRDTDQSRGFGFVTMSTVEEAEKAVEMLNRYEISGRLLNVNKAAPRGSRVERPPRQFASAFRIYVGNLPWQVDESRLEQVFSEHGKVVDARVVYDRETGRSRGFGFVTMASKEELDDAIAALDGQSLDGRALRVNVAEERPRRGF